MHATTTAPATFVQLDAHLQPVDHRHAPAGTRVWAITMHDGRVAAYLPGTQLRTVVAPDAVTPV